MASPSSTPTTPTTTAQADLDRALSNHLASSSSNPNLLTLDREAHVAFARRALGTLPSAYSSLGASRPWLLHWATHSLSLLNAPLSDDPREDASLRESIVSFLEACQCPEKGGFGGGPGQEPHLATSYASVATLVTLGGERALRACDRRKLAAFLQSCIVLDSEDNASEGYGFRVCPGGEVDARGCYCALAASALLRLPPPADPASLAEAAGLANYLRDCQTLEGGIGGFPGGPEAHGGYAFCGAAAAAIALESLREKKKARSDGADNESENSSSPLLPLDLRALLLWSSRCQSPTCGGFAGRTNKLVDGCYSWWQGALFGMTMSGGGSENDDDDGDNGSSSSPVSVAAAVSSSSWPAFDPATLPELPGLPALPEGTTKAPTAAERERGEAEAAAGAAASSESRDAAKAAAEEALAASRVREMLPALSDPSESRKGDNGDGGGGNDDVDDEKKKKRLRRRRSKLLYDPLGLQMWILAYCQYPSSYSLVDDGEDDEEGEGKEKQQNRRRRRIYKGGGLRDKPGKPPDHYHTCYCLSGLSSAQRAAEEAELTIVGGESNRLEKTHGLLNVVEQRVREAEVFFSSCSSSF